MRNIFRIIRAKRRYSPFTPIIIIHQFSPKKSKILSIYQINLFLIKKRAYDTLKKADNKCRLCGFYIPLRDFVIVTIFKLSFFVEFSHVLPQIAIHYTAFARIESHRTRLKSVDNLSRLFR